MMKRLFGVGSNATNDMSAISAGTEVLGRLVSQGDLTIWGKVCSGTGKDEVAVKARGEVSVFAGAEVDGTIVARSITVEDVQLRRGKLIYVEKVSVENAEVGSIQLNTGDDFFPFEGSGNGVKSSVYLGKGSTVYGTVSGDVLELLGTVEGDVTGDEVTIGGTVYGNITATSLLRLLPTAVVKGQISAGSLEMKLGAKVDGVIRLGSEMSERVSDDRSTNVSGSESGVLSQPV